MFNTDNQFYCPTCQRFIELNTHGRCPSCDSDAVVSAHALKNALFASAKAAPQTAIRNANARLDASPDAVHRSPTAVAQREKQEVELIRDFLRKHGYADVAQAWDGWLWEWIHDDSNVVADNARASGVFAKQTRTRLVLTSRGSDASDEHNEHNEHRDFTEWEFHLTWNSVVVELQKPTESPKESE